MPDRTYDWETLPEYLATQQYARCLGRILCSLPTRVRKRVQVPLSGSAILIAQGIAGFNAELPPSEPLTMADREAFRRRALDGIRWSRRGVRLLRPLRGVSQADLLVADELLERVEERIRAAEPPPEWR